MLKHLEGTAAGLFLQHNTHVQHILTNLRQSFVFISFKVRDKGLSEEKQRNFFQTILYLLPLLSCTLLKIKYLQEFLMKK
jgi:hypothetical protein